MKKLVVILALVLGYPLAAWATHESSTELHVYDPPPITITDVDPLPHPVTVTQTVTVTVTESSPPPSVNPCVSAPWPTGSSLPARIAESTGLVRPVTNSAELRTALAGMNPGDIIDISDGASFGDGEANYLANRSGTAAAPITIQGGPGVRLGAMLRIEGDFIRVRNLEIDGTNGTIAWGIYGTNTANDVEICDVEVHGVHVTTSGPNPQGLITNTNTARWHLINSVFRNNGRSPDNVLDHGIYLGGSSHWGINLRLADNAAFGVQFYSFCTNCTFTHITATGNRIKGGIHSGGTSTGIRVFNSVAQSNGTYGFENISSGTYAGDHLVSWLNPSGAYRSISPCASCLTADPATAAIDFSNPAYSPPWDLNGNPRDSQPDAGALEVG